MTGPAPSGFFFEDAEVGRQMKTPRHKVAAARVRAYSDVTGDRGASSAPPLYGLSLVSGMTMVLGILENAVASLGWDNVRFLRPLYIGDEVHCRLRIIEKRSSRQPDRGVTREAVTLINQRGEVVIEAEHASLLWRREPKSGVAI